MKWLLAFAVVIACIVSSFAQDAPAAAAHEPLVIDVQVPPAPVNDNAFDTRTYDGEPVRVREFDKEKWKKIIGDTDYDESDQSGKKKTTRRQGSGSGAESENRMEPAEIEESESEPFLPSWDAPWLKFVGYVIIAVLVLFILYAVFKDVSTRRKIVRFKHTDAGNETIENIEELDVRSQLEQAMADRNYRLAIRLYYLELLKILNEKRLISWEKDKTNREYLSELFSQAHLYTDVRNVTFAYETVWYGGYALSNDALRAIINRFETINDKLKTPVAP